MELLLVLMRCAEILESKWGRSCHPLQISKHAMIVVYCILFSRLIEMQPRFTFFNVPFDGKTIFFCVDFKHKTTVCIKKKSVRGYFTQNILIKFIRINWMYQKKKYFFFLLFLSFVICQKINVA